MVNVCLMMDANARFAVCKELKKLRVTPAEFLKNRDKFMELYKREITNTYIQNARWSIRFGEELFTQSKEPSDYVVFVYNYENRRRKYWQLIKKAIVVVGNEVIDRLSKYGNIYAFGIDKNYWKKVFPKLKKLRKPARDENRAIFGFGFQQKRGYDESVKFVRKIDYFLRASQLRFSGMYFPALDNALFVLLTHPPCLYNPSKLVGEIISVKKEDVAHDEFNIYDKRVYEEWSKYVAKQPVAIISSISRVPKIIKCK